MAPGKANAKYHWWKKKKSTKGKERKRQPTIIVGSEYCVPHEVDLCLETKLWTLQKHIFNVSSDKGKINWDFIMCDPARPGKKKFLVLDNNGKMIMTLHDVMTFMHPTWKVYKGDGTDEKDLLFTVKLPRVFWKTDLEVYLPSTKEEKGACDYKVVAEWLSSNCVIQEGGSSSRTIAQVDVSSGLCKCEVYNVTVSPDVDHAFIAVLVVLYAFSMFGFSVLDYSDHYSY